MPKKISPANIEIELDSILESLHGTNKQRACLFNLIIYAKCSQRSSYLNKVTQKIIEKYPCRIILVTYDKNITKQNLDVNVSVMSAEDGNIAIVCDLIEIFSGDKDHPKIPFVILPHIIPDLPIYLVHADEPVMGNAVAEKLESLAERIIFDSESTRCLITFAKSVIKHSQKFEGDIADLNWARTEEWRVLFANIFNTKHNLDDLENAKTIRIFYNEYSNKYFTHTIFQSTYFHTWLAVQLNWKIKSITSKNEIIYTKGKNTIHIEIEGVVNEKVPPGRIVSIEVETAESVVYNFSRQIHKPTSVVVQKTSPKSCGMPSYFFLEKEDSGQSLVKEIYHFSTSSHFMNVLEYLSTNYSEEAIDE